VKAQSRRYPRDKRVDNGPHIQAMKGFQGLVILIVEDDTDGRELMQAVLEQRGANVVTAESVARAFELFESQRPDVIVSDIAMPDEDGIALVHRLRALPEARGGRTPLIAVSAFSGNADRARALDAGFDRYLHKPVDFDELSATIASLAGTNVERAQV
jgi:CheY-like chemotaxis protein